MALKPKISAIYKEKTKHKVTRTNQNVPICHVPDDSEGEIKVQTLI